MSHRNGGPAPAERRTAVERYIRAEGAGDLKTVAALLHDDLCFRLGSKKSGKAEYLAVLMRLGVVWQGNRIKRIFVDGDEACALYDFLSDTPAGAVPCVEWIRFRGDKICKIDFLFERENWEHVEREIVRRAQPGGESGE